MTGFAAPSPAIRASGLEGATHSMLGLGALVDEMAGQASPPPRCCKARAWCRSSWPTPRP